MTPIDQGVDCRRRLKKPRNRLRLERRTIYAEPEELVRLNLLEVPLECAASCYTWRHVTGGGTLDEEVGTSVWFRASMDTEECEGVSVINVSCAESLLDTAIVTIHKYIGKRCTGRKPYTLLIDPVAYNVITGEIHEGEHTGSTYTKPDGTKALALESIEATYITKYYDCNHVLCATRNVPYLRMYGTTAPVTQLIAKYGHLVGKVVDYRTKKMKELHCCPPKVFRYQLETK